MPDLLLVDQLRTRNIHTLLTMSGREGSYKRNTCIAMIFFLFMDPFFSFGGGKHEVYYRL